MATGLEVAAIKLGAIVVKVASRALFGEAAPDVLTSELTDILTNRFTSLLDCRRAEHAFNQIGDTVAERILTSYGSEFRNLEANERTAAIIAVTTTFTTVPLTSNLVVTKDIDPAAILAHLRSGDSGRAMRGGLSEDGRDFYNILLRECTHDIVSIIRTLPTFTPDALTEALRRLTELAEQVRTSSDKLMARVAPFDYSEFEELYRRHALEKMRSFDLEAEDLYSYARRYDLSRAYINMTASTLEAETQRFNLGDFADRKRLIIVGEGRSGTTGVLRRLFLQAISRSFAGSLASWNSDIPIFLQLRRFESEPPTPKHFLARVAGDLIDEMPQGWVQHNLRKGNVLLLINGLAEVSPARRETIVAWIRELSTGFPNIRYVLESSIAIPELADLQQLGFTISKLNNIATTEVARFIAKWHEAVAHGMADSVEKAKVFERCRQLHDGLRACPQLTELAGNPTLCALICAFHLNDDIEIPNNWMEILPRILAVILDQRDRRRNVDNIGLSYPKYIYLASDLAYWLVRNKWPQVDSMRLQTRLAQKLPLIPGATVLDAEKVKHDLTRRGILRTDSDNQYKFAADTIRSYLAALGIIQADDIGYAIAQAHEADMRDIVILIALHASPEQLRELLHGIGTRRRREHAHRFRLLQLETRCRAARDAAMPVLLPGLSTPTPVAEGMP